MSNIKDTLKERGSSYGGFVEQSRVAQNIKLSLKDSRNWELLSDDKKEALETIATKFSRILNGDPEYQDNWHDIIGYSKLIENELIKNQNNNLTTE